MSDGRALDWDDTITVDDAFTLIPKGEYNYNVLNWERASYAGGTKIPACKKAIINLQILDDSGNEIGTVSENLFLHSKQEWKLSEFFRSIGQKKHGEQLVMNWNEVPGSHGRCEITVRKFTKNDGTEGESNNVKFLDPKPADTSFPPAEEQNDKGTWA